jgi:hypothetical protein
MEDIIGTSAPVGEEEEDGTKKGLDKKRSTLKRMLMMGKTKKPKDEKEEEVSFPVFILNF